MRERERRVKIYKIIKSPQGNDHLKNRVLLTFINEGDKLCQEAIDHIQAWVSVEGEGILRLAKSYKEISENW